MKKRIMENIDGVEVVKMVEPRVPSVIQEHIEEQEMSFKQDEDISLMIRLLRDIYYHTLGQSGDRSNYPCPQIDKVLMDYGINLKETEEGE